MRIADRECAPQRRGPARCRGGTGDTGGRGGGGGEGPARRASRGHIYPLAAAGRAGAEIELDCDVFERASARGEHSSNAPVAGEVSS